MKLRNTILAAARLNQQNDLCAQRSLRSTWMPRLIWDFVERTDHFVGFVMLRLICLLKRLLVFSYAFCLILSDKCSTVRPNWDSFLISVAIFVAMEMTNSNKCSFHFAKIRISRAYLFSAILRSFSRGAKAEGLICTTSVKGESFSMNLAAF